MPIPETLALAAAAAGRLKGGVLTAVGSVFPALRPIFGANIFVSAEFGAQEPETAYLGSLARLGAPPERRCSWTTTPAMSRAPSAPGSSAISSMGPPPSPRRSRTSG